MLQCGGEDQGNSKIAVKFTTVQMRLLIDCLFVQVLEIVHCFSRACIKLFALVSVVCLMFS